MHPDSVRVHSFILRVLHKLSELLSLLTGHPRGRALLPCIVLAHNEGTILPEFLRHYRDIGVDRFFIVDDRSTDHSLEYLSEQPDVTIYAPVEGSTYRRDKRIWRAEVLDRHCDGAWVVVPDVDEHLHYHDIEQGRDLLAVIASLEDEGAEALHAVMLDMYDDRPLQDHRFADGRLIDSFPLFDGPDHYFRLAVSWRTRRKFPTPACFAFGGMRQRLFEQIAVSRDTRQGRLLHKYCDIGGDFSPEGFALLKLRWAHLRLRQMLHTNLIYNCSKIPLLKWREGMRFQGGAHAISQPLRLSQQRAALLHFKFSAGADGLRYIAQRGQHASGSRSYHRMIDQTRVMARSPVFEGTLRYQTSASLGRFLN